MASAAGKLRGQSPDVESIMERLCYEDDGNTVEFYRDLISTDGLRRTWSDLMRRLHSLDVSNKKLWEVASRASLDRSYVTRPEYTDMVQGEHQRSLDDHATRLQGVETDLTNTRKTTDMQHKRLGALDNRATGHERLMENLTADLKAASAKSEEQHQHVLELQRKADEAAEGRDGGLWRQIGTINERLQKHDEQISHLLAGFEKQQNFLDSSALGEHIRKVSRDLLTEYVHKDELIQAASDASSHLVVPLTQGLEKLNQDLDRRVAGLAEQDRTLAIEIGRAEEKQAQTQKELEYHVQSLGGRIELCATNVKMDKTVIEINSRIQSSEDGVYELRRESTVKFQELVSRLKEFQVILEDHEHALQHHAEELLNRATKYDFVSCTQKIEQCAIREKVEAELKDLNETVKWQMAQLEVMGYQTSFVTKEIKQQQEILQQHQQEQQKQQARPRRQSAAPQAASDGAGGAAAVDGTDLASPVAATGAETSLASTEATTNAPLSPEQQASLQSPLLPGRAATPPKVPRYVTPPPVYGSVDESYSTEAFTLLRNQIEALAHGMLGLGHLAIKSQTAGLAREKRESRETELLYHLACLVQWVMHKRAPLSWEPERLTTFSLRSMNRVGLEGRPPPSYNATMKGRLGSSQASPRTETTSAGESQVDVLGGSAWLDSSGGPSPPPRQQQTPQTPQRPVVTAAMGQLSPSSQNTLPQAARPGPPSALPQQRVRPTSVVGASRASIGSTHTGDGNLAIVPPSTAAQRPRSQSGVGAGGGQGGPPNTPSRTSRTGKAAPLKPNLTVSTSPAPASSPQSSKDASMNLPPLQSHREGSTSLDSKDMDSKD